MKSDVVLPEKEDFPKMRDMAMTTSGFRKLSRRTLRDREL